MATTTSYHTIANPAEGMYADKGSKFIGYVLPVTTEEEFKSALKKIKSEHAGARHFCYAYRIGSTILLERSNDDGEPSGTAGKPIINQLLSNQLTNVGVIVVRYFGGTLLGTTGLIKAYKSAAKLAIENATVIEKEITFKQEIAIPYSAYNDFMNLAKKYNIQTKSLQSSETENRFMLEIPLKIENIWTKELNQLLNENK